MFFQKLLSCTISSDSSLYIHAIFFKTKLLIIVTNDDNAMHKKLICWKTFLSSLLYTLMHVKKWKSEGTKRFYMYKAAKRHCMVGSQLRSTISNMIKFLPLLLGL